MIRLRYMNGDMTCDRVNWTERRPDVPAVRESLLEISGKWTLEVDGLTVMGESAHADVEIFFQNPQQIQDLQSSMPISG